MCHWTPKHAAARSCVRVDEMQLCFFRWLTQGAGGCAPCCARCGGVAAAAVSPLCRGRSAGGQGHPCIARCVQLPATVLDGDGLSAGCMGVRQPEVRRDDQARASIVHGLDEPASLWSMVSRGAGFGGTWRRARKHESPSSSMPASSQLPLLCASVGSSVPI